MDQAVGSFTYRLHLVCFNTLRYNTLTLLHYFPGLLESMRCCRNGNNAAMFKDVPYFCYSHLLALITVAPAVTTLAPIFNELLLPNSPIYLDKVLTPEDIA